MAITCGHIHNHTHTPRYYCTLPICTHSPYTVKHLYLCPVTSAQEHGLSCEAPSLLCLLSASLSPATLLVTAWPFIFQVFLAKVGTAVSFWLTSSPLKLNIQITCTVVPVQLSLPSRYCFLTLSNNLCSEIHKSASSIPAICLYIYLNLLIGLSLTASSTI